MKILITGGAGFIGSALVRYLVMQTDHKILNLDKLTYAGNLESLATIDKNPRYQFTQGDVCDQSLVTKLLFDFQPDIVMHLAAESHVDRSIDGPAEFIMTNIMGSYAMLECCRKYYESLAVGSNFRFHHISTDEVYGSLGEEGFFTEITPYDPNSPYSASKASSDHLVRAWHRTFGFPVLLTNCSNNYGPYQFPEKLIPLVILNALEGKALPVYGNGQQIRDWLFVDDHVHALYKVVTEGRIGETYNIGGNSEKTNLEVVHTICAILDDLRPATNLQTKDGKKIQKYQELITFVTDRPGHDKRYAIDASKIRKELGWVPKQSFVSGLEKTIIWYLNNASWRKYIQDGSYQRQRLGIIHSN